MTDPGNSNWLDDLDIPPPQDDDMPIPEEEAFFFDGEPFEAPARPSGPVEISPQEVDACLRERFGLTSFREGQRDVIETVLSGRSALAVMPTGAGKSLCFQLPALLLPGISLVISPLIALMKDQVDSLQARGLPATFINSSLSLNEQRERLAQMRRGETKLVFVAPERFRSSAFRHALSQVYVSLFVIDEAHCISEWGHDFRPDYMRLGEARRELGEPVTLALTATATPKVRTDIVRQLGIDGADIFVSGFERPNLFMEVYKAKGKKDKLGRMEALLHHMGGTGIVYCATRKAVDEIAGELRVAGFTVGAYHGGLPDAERDRIQDEFMAGAYQVLVATNAFGMGVDKSDIRAIVHYQIPGSLEAYYQEAGRAGRDGEPAHCLLLYNYADRFVPDFFIKSAHPEREVIEGTWEAIIKGQRTYDTHRLARQVKAGRRKVSAMAVGAAMRILRTSGHIDYQASSEEPIEILRRGRLQVSWPALENRRLFEEEKLQKMIYYAAGKRCRTADMLRYFGSRTSFEDRCGHCDNCAEVPPYASAAVATRRPKLQPGPTPARATSPEPARERAASSEDLPLIDHPEDTLTVARKILACIARGRQRLSVTMTSAILSGSKSSKITRYGHDQNSTYGLLGALSARQITALIDDMLEARFLDSEGVCLRLTPLAVDVMKGQAELPAELADTLEARFKRTRPESVRKAMANILGMGEPRLSSPEIPARTGRVTQTIAETIARLTEGQTVEEIARTRDIKAQTVVSHVIKAARAGALGALDFDPYVDEGILAGIRDTVERVNWEESLRDFREEVCAHIGGRRISYELLKMNIAYLIREGDLS